MDKKLYKLMDWARIEGLVYSEEDRPHDFLGAHYVPGGLLIQAYLPGIEDVKKVSAVVKMGSEAPKEQAMELMDETGFYAAFIRTLKKVKYDYHYKVTLNDGTVNLIDDPYRFESTVSDKDIAKLNAGIHYDSYSVMGAHIRTVNGIKGVSFAVWAPNAVRVSVVGDFNNWDGRRHQMRRLEEGGIFEIFIPGVDEGCVYKYELKLKGDIIKFKADPYGFGAELRPATASVVRDITGFEWTDEEWLERRKEIQGKDKPLSIYEVHLGSFKKPDDGREFYNYRELAPLISDYVLKMGYTHIEVMPVMEHPLDESWGYQVVGYYAPTSRYGTPHDLMYFIDHMHKMGIGVILDWVPAHFPKDDHGLSEFDGTCLYEHLDPRQGYHPHWRTSIYNYGRPQVSNYLLANALYWIKEYHADGIRMDAVASMLYLDYGKQDGQWVANIYGGNENLDAVEFLKHFNSIHGKLDDGSIVIAEESTAWPKVSGSLLDDGLGFDYKWNMGWMNDFTEFMRYDPLFRSGHYSELTFSMIYAYSERFILVFSHDEVVHGKASMLAKMPGERRDKFANLRAAYGYMMTHPGKILSFMGQDIGEWDEWNEQRSVQWELLQYDEHKYLNAYVSDMLKFYKSNPALYELDNEIEGFEWINNISGNECIIVFLRKCPSQTLLVVCNFANISRDQYKIGVPFAGKYKEIFNSDDVKYGGTGYVNPRVKVSKYDECDGRDDSLRIKVAPLSVSVFRYDGPAEPKKPSAAKGGKKGKSKAAGARKDLRHELEDKYNREERGLTD
ncbi:MAG: 1,4-alpha-glucan branching protein GlgB [Lachnospiraceae bacterium]|nr:1,4-alpha-glucan branching protein GlgB [Lachnospiraceae bacterium]